jgi:hypothetical protein
MTYDAGVARGDVSGVGTENSPQSRGSRNPTVWPHTFSPRRTPFFPIRPANSRRTHLRRPHTLDPCAHGPWHAHSLPPERALLCVGTGLTVQGHVRTPNVMPLRAHSDRVRHAVQDGIGEPPGNTELQGLPGGPAYCMDNGRPPPPQRQWCTGRALRRALPNRISGAGGDRTPNRPRASELWHL